MRLEMNRCGIPRLEIACSEGVGLYITFVERLDKSGVLDVGGLDVGSRLVAREVTPITGPVARH